MDPLDVVWILGGIGLLALAAVDIFLSVLHYDGYGPASRRLYRGSWWLARRVAGSGPNGASPRLLAMAGTLLLLATIVMWILLAWIGFALLYLPAIDDAFVRTAPPGERWLDALYFSGTSLSTVGFGDIVALDPALRLLSVVESLAGFALLTVTISYLLGVYGVLRDQSLLAAMIDDQTDGTGDPLRLAESLRERNGTATKLDELHRRLLGHAEGLRLYPVVRYLRREVSRRSAVFILRMVGEASADLRWALPASDPLARDPALAGLLRAQRRLIDDVRSRLGSGRFEDANGEAAEGELTARFDAARAALGYGDGADDERCAEWSAFVRELDAAVAMAAAELAYGPAELGLGEDGHPPDR